jgi:hypothetical protein
MNKKILVVTKTRNKDNGKNDGSEGKIEKGSKKVPEGSPWE